jgi:hypothetical protein
VTDVAYLCHNCGSVHEVESIRENLILDLRTAASYELSGHRGMVDPRTRFLRWRMARGLAQALWPAASGSNARAGNPVQPVPVTDGPLSASTPPPRSYAKTMISQPEAASTYDDADRTAACSGARELFEQKVEVDHGDPHGRVAAAVGQHDAVAVDHRATGVDDVRDVTIAFRLVGDQKRLR